MGKGDYRVFSDRATRARSGSALHLVREDAEASLCGIPRAALGAGEAADDLVCVDCIDWLLKRRAVSGQSPRPDRA